MHATYKFGKALVNLNTTISLMKLVAKTGCSLKTLRLSWRFKNCDYSLYELDAASYMIGGDEGIPHAIAGLKVQKKIEITVNSNDAGHYSRCEAFTSGVGSFMQWAGTKVIKKCIKRSLEVGGGVKEEVQEYEKEHLIEWPKQKNSTNETSSDSDTDDANVDSDIALKEFCNDIGIRYIWTWTLTPTATMVGDGGSKTRSR